VIDRYACIKPCDRHIVSVNTCFYCSHAGNVLRLTGDSFGTLRRVEIGIGAAAWAQKSEMRVLSPLEVLALESVERSGREAGK